MSFKHEREAQLFCGIEAAMKHKKNLQMILQNVYVQQQN
jgi:hypothetical protein